MKRMYWVLSAALVLAIAGGYAYKTRQNTASASQSALAAKPAPSALKLELLSSDVAQLEPVSIGQVLLASGTIRALQQSQVKSQVSAVVTQVTVLEGQSVRAGQTLATTDVQDYQTRLNGSQAALSQAQAQVLIAQRAVDNNKALIEKGFISPTAADTALQQLDANKAAVKVAQANIDLAQKALKDTLIVSPIAGVVTEKLISAGDKVSPDMRVFTIVKPGAVEFEANLPAAEATQLKLGQAIVIEPEGLPAINASITRLSPSANSVSRSVAFYSAIQNASQLRPGSYATGKVQMNHANVLAVPAAAVREEAGRSVVYTVNAQNELQSIPVTVLLRGEDKTGNTYAAVEGIAAGTQYVKRNLGPLRVGSTVTVKP